jgi:hypothetical protein
LTVVGFEALEEIKTAVESNSQSKIIECSGRFFSIIPHAFGRQRPPPINTLEAIQEKEDMLNTLTLIEERVSMTRNLARRKSGAATVVPHPSDQQYVLGLFLTHTHTHTHTHTPPPPPPPPSPPPPPPSPPRPSCAY